jgi:hypothetical protein
LAPPSFGANGDRGCGAFQILIGITLYLRQFELDRQRLGLRLSTTKPRS